MHAALKCHVYTVGLFLFVVGRCCQWSGNWTNTLWCFSYVIFCGELFFLCSGSRICPSVLVSRYFNYDA